MNDNIFPVKIEVDGETKFVRYADGLPVDKSFTILETRVKVPEPTKYERYLTSYDYKNLSQKHSLNEEGIWEVYGEDPNCDFGGPHHQPFLGVFEGKLENVIRHAVELKGFWQWGAGGTIKKAKQNKVTKV